VQVVATGSVSVTAAAAAAGSSSGRVLCSSRWPERKANNDPTRETVRGVAFARRVCGVGVDIPRALTLTLFSRGPCGVLVLCASFQKAEELEEARRMQAELQRGEAVSSPDEPGSPGSRVSGGGGRGTLAPEDRLMAAVGARRREWQMVYSHLYMKARRNRAHTYERSAGAALSLPLQHLFNPPFF
jgi:hypothetical protein